MKSILLLTFFAIFFSACSLSNDESNEADRNEFSDYDYIRFRRVDSQSHLDYEDKDYPHISINLNDRELGHVTDFVLDEPSGPEDSLSTNPFEYEGLININLEDNIFHIEGEKNEFTFTPNSRSVYQLENGTRYQLRVTQDGETLDENPFYEED